MRRRGSLRDGVGRRTRPCLVQGETPKRKRTGIRTELIVLLWGEGGRAEFCEHETGGFESVHDLVIVLYKVRYSGETEDRATRRTR